MQLYRNDSLTLIRAFQYIRNRGGQAEVGTMLRKALNLSGRPPKKINEIARDLFKSNHEFYEVDEGIWAFKFPAVFEDAMKKEHFVAVDIEATGGKPPIEKMVEIGAAKYRKSREISEFSYLINPEKPIQPFVARMTGLDDKLLSKAHNIEWVMTKFMEFITDEILIIHDPFPDMSFIDKAALDCFGGVIYNPIIDTLALAKRKLGLHSGLNLSKIQERLDIETPHEHRALADARVAAEAYFIMRELGDIEQEETTDKDSK